MSAILGVLMFLGLVSGLALAVLGHPAVYKAVFRKADRASLDHRGY